MVTTGRDELYTKFAPTAEAAAGRIWSVHREELLAFGVELDDLLQQARLDLLGMIEQSLNSDHAGAANYVFLSISGLLRNKFLNNLDRNHSQLTPNLEATLAQPDKNYPKTLTQTLLYYDEMFCGLVLQGHKPYEARRMMGWNLAQYRAFKKRLAKKLGVKDG